MLAVRWLSTRWPLASHPSKSQSYLTDKQSRQVSRGLASSRVTPLPQPDDLLSIRREGASEVPGFLHHKPQRPKSRFTSLPQGPNPTDSLPTAHLVRLPATLPDQPVAHPSRETTLNFTHARQPRRACRKLSRLFLPTPSQAGQPGLTHDFPICACPQPVVT